MNSSRALPFTSAVMVMTASGMQAVNAFPGAGLMPGTLYVTEIGSDKLLSIDRATGAASVVADLSPSINITGLAWDSSAHVMYGVDNGFTGGGEVLRTIDLDSGAMSVVGLLNPSQSINMLGLAYDAVHDVLYGSGFASLPAFHNALFTIDRAAGLATEVGPTGSGHNVAGLAFDSESDTLYGVDTFTDQLVTLDRVTGASAVVGPLSASGVYTGLGFDGDILWGAWNPSENASQVENLISIDQQTGSAAVVGAMSPYHNVQGMEFVPVPEASSGLLITGLLLLARRRSWLTVHRF